MKRKNTIFSKLYVVLCLAFFYLPILVTMIFSFNSSKSLTRFTGFSLRWYGELINNMEISKAVYVSVTVAILATIISTVLGTITAIGLSKSRKVLKELVLTINNFPILNPEIVTAIGLMLLFSSLGMTKGYLTMLLAHIAFCTPYVITSVYPKVRNLDPNLANAAMDLGATPYQALTKVIVPMIKEGIFAGALLAFTMSFDDFVISYFVSGNGVKNISIVVYNMTKRINPTINALSTLVIVVIVLVLLFANLILPKLQDSTVKKMNPRTRKIVAAVTAVILVVVFGKWTLVSQGSHVLRVYNAGEYMDLNLIDKFEKQYNCTIVYETFESNEMMYTKLASGETYDVLVPSDYMIERLIKEEYLQSIDWKKIPNKKNLLPEVQNKDYDPGNRYSCPYFWGTVGIVYDKTKVDIKDLEKEGYNIFLDQKYNRLAIQKLCKGAKVLDCFTHTGSFALNAGIAGAQSVLGVDASETAVNQARRNAELNGLDGTVKFLCEDVFELLPELEEKGEKFDVVILDPPAFTKSRSSVKNAVKGYREINLRAMRLVKDGGFLATCSCSHFMTYELFTQTIGQAAKNVHKRLRQVEYRTQAPDHPILWSADESYYLKFYIFQVCNDR